MALASDLEAVVEHGQLPEFKQFPGSIDARWIEEMLNIFGKATVRKRRLPAEQVLWLVIGMGLMRDRPIKEVATKLDLVLPDARGSVIAPSALCWARKRLGSGPLACLFARTADVWGSRSAACRPWKGLKLFSVDGTTLRVQDTEENRNHFGLVSGGKDTQSSYPVVRLAALMALCSHMLVAVRFGPYKTSELALSDELWPALPDDSLVILDRNFVSPRSLWPIQSGGDNRHWLVRMRKKTKWKELKHLGEGDLLVELETSWHTRKQFPSLPRKRIARAIRYEPPGGKPGWLLTSLLDPELYPSVEVAALYHDRWEIELGYDEIKTDMLLHATPLRSKTVEGVEQEIWGLLIAYNLVRLEMEKIAGEAKVEPTRISFIVSFRFIRDEWLWCALGTPGTIPKKLHKLRQTLSYFILPPRRSSRRYERAVKSNRSPYPKKKRLQPAPEP